VYYVILLLYLLAETVCYSIFFFGRSYGHFRRRRGGNWLENLAKHRARRLVYYVLLSVREEIDCSESTEIARGGHDTPKTREAMEP